MTYDRMTRLISLLLAAACVALSAGCGGTNVDNSVKQQQLHQRDDTQGGSGNKTHSGNLK